MIVPGSVEWQVAQPATLPITDFLKSASPSPAILALLAAEELQAASSSAQNIAKLNIKNKFLKVCSIWLWVAYLDLQVDLTRLIKLHCYRDFGPGGETFLLVNAHQMQTAGL